MDKGHLIVAKTGLQEAAVKHMFIYREVPTGQYYRGNSSWEISMTGCLSEVPVN